MRFNKTTVLPVLEQIQRELDAVGHSVQIVQSTVGVASESDETRAELGGAVLKHLQISFLAQYKPLLPVPPKRWMLTALGLDLSDAEAAQLRLYDSKCVLVVQCDVCPGLVEAEIVAFYRDRRDQVF